MSRKQYGSKEPGDGGIGPVMCLLGRRGTTALTVALRVASPNHHLGELLPICSQVSKAERAAETPRNVARPISLLRHGVTFHLSELHPQLLWLSPTTEHSPWLGTLREKGIHRSVSAASNTLQLSVALQTK